MLHKIFFTHCNFGWVLGSACVILFDLPFGLGKDEWDVGLTDDQLSELLTAVDYVNSSSLTSNWLLIFKVALGEMAVQVKTALLNHNYKQVEFGVWCRENSLNSGGTRLTSAVEQLVLGWKQGAQNAYWNYPSDPTLHSNAFHFPALTGLSPHNTLQLMSF